jgi:hypothetical protein
VEYVTGRRWSGTLLLAPGSALGIDTDGDGYHDALVREQPDYPYANVGSNCDLWK